MGTSTAMVHVHVHVTALWCVTAAPPSYIMLSYLRWSYYLLPSQMHMLTAVFFKDCLQDALFFSLKYAVVRVQPGVWVRLECAWSCGVMVSTWDSESQDPSSNLGRTFTTFSFSFAQSNLSDACLLLLVTLTCTLGSGTVRYSHGIRCHGTNLARTMWLSGTSGVPYTLAKLFSH